MRIWQTSLPEPKAQFGVDRGHLFLVADGMGGHRTGEVASALAVVAIEQFTLNTFKWFFDSNGPDASRSLRSSRPRSIKPTPVFSSGCPSTTPARHSRRPSGCRNRPLVR
jgi:hypothetical protein